MKTKAKGFTLIEVIITLAIKTVILGAIYTFFFTSNKTLTTTEINSALQTEAQLIENKLLKIGEESSGLLQIEASGVEINKKYNEIKDKLNNGIKTQKLKFKCENNVELIEYKDTELKINGQVISNNVSKFKVKPLDLYMADEEEAKLIDTNGLEMMMTLKMKKGYSEVEYPLSIIVKFRNKG